MLGFGGKAFSPDRDIPSLKGKVILVTGGNTGLGKETVLQLAKHEPKQIYLAARTPSKAEAAIEEIQKAVPGSDIKFLQLDLASLASVRKAAKEFESQSDRLDILINNAGMFHVASYLTKPQKLILESVAGIMMLPFSKTEDGYEIQFGTNHVGHALFTKLLLPTLLKTAEEPDSDVRIVNLSSAGHMMAPGIIYEQDRLASYSDARRYGQSKLANILHARQLAKRYPSITTTSVHPGVIITDLYASVNKTSFGVTKLLPYLFRTSVGSGAYNQLWAATAPKDTVRQSYYWTPVGVKSGGSFWYAQKEKLSEDLWEWTEKELEKSSNTAVA